MNVLHGSERSLALFRILLQVVHAEQRRFVNSRFVFVVLQGFEAPRKPCSTYAGRAWLQLGGAGPLADGAGVGDWQPFAGETAGHVVFSVHGIDCLSSDGRPPGLLEQRGHHKAVRQVVGVVVGVLSSIS